MSIIRNSYPYVEFVIEDMSYCLGLTPCGSVKYCWLSILTEKITSQNFNTTIQTEKSREKTLNLSFQVNRLLNSKAVKLSLLDIMHLLFNHQNTSGVNRDYWQQGKIWMFNEILGEVEHWDRLHLNGPSIVLVFNPFDFCKMNSSVSYQ